MGRDRRALEREKSGRNSVDGVDSVWMSPARSHFPDANSHSHTPHLLFSRSLSPTPVPHDHFPLFNQYADDTCPIDEEKEKQRTQQARAGTHDVRSLHELQPLRAQGQGDQAHEGDERRGERSASRYGGGVGVQGCVVDLFMKYIYVGWGWG